MSTEHEHKEEEDVGDDYDPEGEAQVVPTWDICHLPEVPVVTGEEEEDMTASFRIKLYRWRGEWKERGLGELKLLKHKKSGLIRVLARAEKTHKCLMNHLLQSKQVFCKLEPLKTSTNSWVWAAYDISDEKPQT
jgi:hypothetical protein